MFGVECISVEIDNYGIMGLCLDVAQDLLNIDNEWASLNIGMRRFEPLEKHVKAA